MMVNIRGFKGKEYSMKEIIEERKPTILMMMETLCQKEEISIDGYSIYSTKKRTDMWGGIVFAVLNEIENQIEIISESTDNGEIIFAQIICGRKMATFGLVYAPQESETTVEKIDEMYSYIQTEVQAAKAENHMVVIGGDFNCKIGGQIAGNKKEVSKGGRRLIRMAANNELTIINTTEKCQGLWTRTQIENGIERKSVIDYILISEEHEHLVKSMIIDEEKEITPFRDDSPFGRLVYTDHRMLTLNMNMAIKENEEEMKINRKKMDKFKNATDNSHLTELVQNGSNIHQFYKQWSESTLNIMKSTCGQRRKAKIEPKEIRVMRRKRKTLKDQMIKSKNLKEKQLLNRRRKMIQQHIVRKRKVNNRKQIFQVARNIKDKGIFNRTAYWDFMKAMKGKRKFIKGRAINDKEGNRIDDPEKVKERYREFYAELLTTKEPETNEEREVEELVNKCIENMLLKAQNIDIEPVTDEEYNNMKLSLRKNKAPDQQGWFYEMIVHAGTDLEESIKIMINKILQMKEIPQEWNEMGILPIDKTNGWLEMSEKRGLFMTNIISKCMEKILFDRREVNLRKNISPFQNGGMKKRAIQDNLFIKNHIIHKYKKEKKNLYLLYADIEKCFDNLWLKDCILELVRCGVPLEEAMFIYKMNENIEATVRTPVGNTDPIQLKEIVRQGTVGGNKLCVVSTDRINRMGSYQETDGLRYPVFVDDKLGIGNPETIKEMCGKMKILEVTKKYRYNVKKGKTEWMLMKNNQKKKDEEVLDLEVKSGKIGRTMSYKYHGDMYDHKGTNMSKIMYKQTKIDMMITKVKAESSPRKIGKAALSVRIMLLEAVITPTVLCSTETWHNITKPEQQQITKLHHKILTEALHQPKTMPYMGIISERNILPFMEIVWYKKFMWYHMLINSWEDRQS